MDMERRLLVFRDGREGVGGGRDVVTRGCAGVVVPPGDPWMMQASG
jgi:hypothetical protein